jgi:poly [ADP-ribose] polymerase
MRYVLTDIVSNHNKFWHIRLFADGAYETHWGRVGENGQIKRFLPSTGGEAIFNAKCREKESKGYRLQRTLEGTAGTPSGSQAAIRAESGRLAEVAAEQIQTDSPETLSLVRYLAAVNVHQILSATTLKYDAGTGLFSTPLGIVTADGIGEARRLLNEIAAFVADANWSDAGLSERLNDYLMLIPQNLGRSRPDPRVLFPGMEAIRAQNGILDSLEASLQTVLTRTRDSAESSEATPAAAPQLFEARLRVISDASEIERIRGKYRATQQAIHASHRLDVTNVFDLEITTMADAFRESGMGRGNVQELWHGTRAGNLLSILKSGFTIAPSSASHVTGRLFGNGVYFSDQSTKSLNYACGAAPRQRACDGTGAERADRFYMLLCDVAMGKSFTPDGYGCGSLPRAGFDSTFAEAGRSGILNNEMIVYNTAQINPTRLVEFGPATS